MKELDIVNDILSCNIAESQINKSVKEVIDWDSYASMNFMAELQDRYHSEVNMEDVMMVKQVGELIQIVKKYEEQ